MPKRVAVDFSAGYHPNPSMSARKACSCPECYQSKGFVPAKHGSMKTTLFQSLYDIMRCTREHENNTVFGCCMTSCSAQGHRAWKQLSGRAPTRTTSVRLVDWNSSEGMVPALHRCDVIIRWVNDEPSLQLTSLLTRKPV